MKKTVLASVLGAAGLLGLAASSYGQGAIIFDTYAAVPYATVNYGTVAQNVPANLAGTLAGTDVTATLWYALGANQTTGFTLIPGSATTVGGSGAPGFIDGPSLLIPAYTSGAITFEIFAVTASGLYSDAAHPYIWTEALIPTSPSPAGSFAGLNGNIILTPTPEPTTLALAGLGGLASLVAFRRKQS